MHRAIDEVLKNPIQTAPKKLVFSILRVPFLLEPYYDESKPYIESNRERLITKWGGIQGWEEQKRRHNLKGRGIDAGIPHFNLDRLTANTIASHRLIQYLGKTYGLHISELIYDKLNVYYFVEGHSLNDKPKLAQVVYDELQRIHKEGQVGEVVNNDASFPPTYEEILTFLNGNEGRKEIDDALKTLQKLGIHGIPKFIIDGETIVDGAAHSDVFVKIFRNIEREGKTSGKGPIFGNILGVSSEIIQRGSHHSTSLTSSSSSSSSSSKLSSSVSV